MKGFVLMGVAVFLCLVISEWSCRADIKQGVHKRSNTQSAKSDSQSRYPGSPLSARTASENNKSGATHLYNVANYNIHSNDGKPDSKAISDLIHKTEGPSIIFFPAGEYLIDSPIDIDRSNITIRGEEGTVFKFDNSNDYYKIFGVRVGMINICADSITIDHVTMDQNFRGSGRQDGDQAMIGCILSGCRQNAKAVKVSNVVVENCTILDYYGDAISFNYAGSDNITIINNHIISAFISEKWKSAGVSGEQGISIGKGSNIVIRDNDIDGALDDAIAIHRFSNNVLIEGNTITTTGGRIYLNGITDGNVMNNTISYIEKGNVAIWVSFEERGVRISPNYNLKIQKNKISVKRGAFLDAGIRLLGPGENILVCNNVIESEDRMAVGIDIREKVYMGDNEKYFGNNVTIDSNSINNFSIGIRQGTGNLKPEQVKIQNNNRITNSEKLIDRRFDIEPLRRMRKTRKNFSNE